MPRDALTVALKQEAHRLGFDLAGACPAVAPPRIEQFRRWLEAGYAGRMHYLADRASAREHPRGVLAGVRSLLMLGVNYRTVEPSPPDRGRGRVSRYAWGRDYHDVIHARLRSLAEFHRRQVPGVRVRGVVDTAPLAEREFAELAGLGWIGKNTLLINRRFGSWLFLATLLTSEELEYDDPHATNHCGTCRACLDACPTGALTQAYTLDARKCISYLTIESRGRVPPELRPLQGDRLFGCDACQEACPWNRAGPATGEEAFFPLQGAHPIEPAELLRSDDETLRRRLRRTPLWRARPAGLLSSAAIVLGNRPEEAAVPALIGRLGDDNPCVRAACAWALGRTSTPESHQALRDRLAVEPDPEVRAELERALG